MFSLALMPDWLCIRDAQIKKGRWRLDVRKVGIAQQSIEIDAQGVSRQLGAEGGAQAPGSGGG